MKINIIREEKDIRIFLEKRNLLKQYKNNKIKLESGYLGNTDFKERQPKGVGIYSFRINKQFRAIGYFKEDGIFIVVKIDNHQNY